jgi:hypothetical protein
MASSFFANTVSFAPVDGVLTVGFSEIADGSDRYLLLQRQEHETEQDKRLGLVGDYVEYIDQARATYKGVKLVNLQRKSATILFETAAVPILKESELNISFELADSDFKLLQLALNKILGASRVLVV